ncbi:MAG TPA: methylenetetrahydrofolate reductase [Pseudolabrys sp.]|nr:methylenetetrahydrofolate reductase [Pseudolabrys sp.]
MNSTFEAKLRGGRFVLTAEITPPVAFDGSELLAKVMPLKDLADAVNVTDGAGARPHLGALTAAKLLLDAGIEPVLQITCRDRNRIALQSDLMGATAFGIQNLLMLRGDNPSAGDQPDARAVFDLDARGLIATARLLRDKAELPSGRKIAGAAQFFIGAADNPIDPPVDWKPDGLAAKIAAGAQFAQTQFCMDAAVARRYVARLAEHELTEKIFLLIGIVPLKSARSARWIKDRLFGSIIPDALIARMEAAQDPAAEGQAICLELIAALADIPGVAGVHIMAPNNEAVVPNVIAAARKTITRAAE